MKTIRGILKQDLKYESGFLSAKTILSYYDCEEGNSNSGWDEIIDNDVEESSRTHFMDVYNRAIALDAIRPELSGKRASYIDVGCASGYLIEEVKNKYPKADIFGSDFLPESLTRLHNRIPDVPLFRIDLTKARLEPDSFDAITCLNVLEHIEDDEKAIANLYRMTKKGGMLFVSVPMAPFLYDMYDEVHFHIRRYKLCEIEKKIEAAGFKVVKSNFFGFFIFPVFFLVKIINRIKYSGLPIGSKRDLVRKEMRSSGSWKLMNIVCGIESALGRYLKYPFGIRGYIIAQK